MTFTRVYNELIHMRHEEKKIAVKNRQCKQAFTRVGKKVCVILKLCPNIFHRC